MLHQAFNQSFRPTCNQKRVSNSRLVVCRGAGPLHVDVAIAGAGPAGLAAAAALTRADPNLKVVTTVTGSFRNLQEAAARAAGRQKGCVGDNSSSCGLQTSHPGFVLHAAADRFTSSSARR